MKRFFLCLAALGGTLLSLSAQSTPADIIPAPVSYELGKGVYVGDQVQVVRPGRSFAKELATLPDFAREAAYTLTVSKKGIVIQAETELGAFYARQSLLQMQQVCDTLSCCTIVDYPRFAHRGLHFDVSRHFRSKEFILKQLDQMAALKMNSLHFHLVDAAGWRVQVDAYPRLHELGGFRVGTTYKEWERFGYQYDPQGSGGYYTKDELREIVAYAARLHINVMPEIEMPGHSMEVVAAYPETGCLKPDGTPVGFSHDVCPASEATYRLFETVLEEVMDIFPSPYIHVGGDEASKRTWYDCPRCRQMREREGMTSVNEQQAYLMKHMEAFLARHGRKLVGWDEILEGGLPEQATVMSWRGTAGGEKAIGMGHDVIMSPTNYCYLDFYQDAPAYEPEAIGGYQPIDNVYSFDPAGGIDPAAAGHVLGVQGNLWCEFVPTESHFEYMLYPRALAIAEIAWTPLERKDFQQFRSRAIRYAAHMRTLGYNTFDLTREVGHRKAYFKDFHHLAVDKPITFNVQNTSPYRNVSGQSWLNDGKFGDWIYGDRWMGFTTDIDVTIDLGEVTPIHYVGATYFHHPTYSLGLPQRVEVWLSDDGNDYRLVSTVESEWLKEVSRTMHIQLGEAIRAQGRFLRYKAFRVQPWAYEWMFVDEIVVN